MKRLTCLFVATLASAFFLTGGAPEAQSAPKPNILFILTDDQQESTLEHMPNLQREFSQGTTFANTVNVWPLCCPSRTTILRGQYAHNHGVTDNDGESGGWEGFKANALHEDNLATWMQAAGYETAYFGKFLNGYRSAKAPKGWDEWYAYAGKTKIGADMISNGEKRFETKSRVKAEALVARRATEWLESREDSERPYFAVVSFAAPHGPYPHPKSTDSMFEDVRAPRTDAFNEKDVSDKPAYIKSREPLGGRGIKEADQDYRNALRSLVLVDNFVGKTVPSVDGYSFYYTDNGTHNGEHRLPHGKRTPYETDLGFPLLVKGPGVVAGSNGALVGNHDLAPTVASLGRATVPTYVDGRRIESLFSGAKSADWRDAILSESFESSRNIAPVWEAIRTEEEIYVEYEDGFRELYDLSEDPHQTENLLAPRGSGDPRELPARLEMLKRCGAEKAMTCREAEGQ